MIEEDFKYNPEEEDDKKRHKMLRLPYALCKQHGIAIQDWWRPRDAWEALKNAGYVNKVSEEYKNYIRDLKKKAAKDTARRKRWKKKVEIAQKRNPDHIPDYNYQHKDGAIAGAIKGKPMTFEEADSGRVNPFIKKTQMVDGKETLYIGYRHNCQTCVATYIARRNGYDVRALPNLDNKSIRDLSYKTNLAFVDKNGNHPTYERKPKGENTERWLTRQPNGIYSVEFDYVGKNKGHIITAEKTDTGLMFYDPQINRKSYNLREYGNIKNVSIMNLTNISLDERFCDKIMKPLN